MSQVDVDAAFVELIEITGWDRPRLLRYAASPPEIQQLELQNLRDQDWTDPATPAGARFLALLAVIGTVAGVVSGVAGAANAIKTLTGHWP